MAAHTTFDLAGAQTEIDRVENGETPPENRNQLLKAVATAMNLPNANVVLYHLMKGNLTSKTVARPKKAKANASPKKQTVSSVVIQILDGLVQSVKGFPDRSSAIDAAAGMVQEVRDDLEKYGVYNCGDANSGASLQIADVS